ncbi:MAG: 3-phosphoshikimate 1-carboxyvinyltransferase [Candidatus Azotimanducaceae bacterium]|uniref:3-phosphoshikimate 1-carboxyvinyltransferase n=1 Tax=OM182 bacterium TaxID=2510334 RepID=A0A520S3Q6_9GAMM|nr:3-phosphoshikimate 1-carboxyvinyltransferase [Gammaproteobacteria bacterium]OUV67644.1 MAG: 3-phosphoshikimate 1-carboxyvinyltransferase [Gammaproteobacteria bacterium TMED133]RZO77110.1 MAG: 3-phosphoshikimate 1-carboxyvinyltransferase [OM182 bacterium]
MNQLTIKPVDSISGEIMLPGSKSLTNRVLLLAALANGKTEISNLLKSDDTSHMVAALSQLGVEISQENDKTIVTGNSGLFRPPEKKAFFLGNAGTAIRPLTAILSLIPGVYTVDGDEYMRERPIAHLTEALSVLGAKISYTGNEGCPPLLVEGGHIKGGKVSVAGHISSQYLTALLMSLPLVRDESTINVIGEQVSKPYLDITLQTMKDFGVSVCNDNYETFRIPGGQKYRTPGNYLIEGDASSASYFFAAAAIKGKTIVRGLGQYSVQGDIQFLDTIEQMGAEVDRHKEYIIVSKGKLNGVDVDLNHIPDAAMTIAIMALFAEGKTRIRNIYNWRVKETDRMTAMATELRKLGAGVQTTEDSITIQPPDQLKSAEIETYGDHRIAMVFSLAALGDIPITIKDPDCTKKTFPNYFTEFAKISQSNV